MFKILFENFLENIYYIVMTIHAFIIILLFCFNIKFILKPFQDIKYKTWVILFILLITALVLRIGLSPLEEPTWSSDWEYKIIAKNFAVDHKYHECVIGSFSNCEKYDFPPHPGGYPLLLSFFFIFFKSNPFITNSFVLYFKVIIGTLTVFLVFLLSYILFKKIEVSLFSSFILTILPWHIIYSGGPEISVVSLFFNTLALLIFLLTLKTRKRSLFLLSFMIVMFSANIQAENIIMLPIVFMCYILFTKGLDNDKVLREILVPFIISLTISFPMTYWYVFYRTYGQNNIAVFSFSYFKNNFYFFIKFWLGHSKILMSFLLLGLLPFRKYIKQITILSTWFIMQNFIYILYYGMNQVRYVLCGYAAFSITSGLGSYRFFKLFKNKITKFILMVIIIILILFPLTPSNGNIKFTNQGYAVGGYKHDLIINSVKVLDPDSYLITTNTEGEIIGLFTDLKIINFNYIEPTLINNKLRSHKIYFLKSKRCKTTFKSLCDRINNEYETKLVISEENLDLYEITAIKNTSVV